MSDMIHRFFSDFLTVTTESTGDVIIYFALVFLLVVMILIVYYAYNRKKYYEISHQVPARLVREHLNTIIKNSNALKSSLFNEKDLADIADLPEVSTKPAKAPPTGALEALEKEKQELENELKVLRDSMSGEENPDMADIIKERDELLDAISDYKVLEDDLVNLKKLKTENQELKAKLGVSEEEPEVISQEQSEKVQEDVAEKELEAAENVAEAGEVKAESIEADVAAEATGEVKEAQELTEEEKSAEDLLKEFEKMLGQ